VPARALFSWPGSLDFRCRLLSGTVIERIKALPDNERAQVTRFVTEIAGLPARRNFSIATEDDGLPVIRANGGIITSRLVHEIESRTP
jgi:hypothetical protein